MSKYKRDDAEFRARIAELADAGLRFPSARAKLHFDGQHCSLWRERPCNECAQPANVIEPPTRRGHFNLPGLIVGLGYMIGLGVILGFAITGVIALFMGGVH